MAKPSRWTAEKRYQIVKEALSQKEPMGQIARTSRSFRGIDLSVAGEVLRRRQSGVSV